MIMMTPLGWLYQTGIWGVVALVVVCSSVLTAAVAMRINAGQKTTTRLKNRSLGLVAAGFGVWPTILGLSSIWLLEVSSAQDDHPWYWLIHSVYIVTRPVWIALDYLAGRWSEIVAPSDMATVFWPVTVVLYFVPLALVISFPFIVFGGVLIIRLASRHTWAKVKVWLNWSLALLSLSFTISVLTVVGGFLLLMRCQDQIREYHHFNAHLKALCVESDDPSLCPRNLSQLKAFNPRLFRQISSCAPMEYTYDESSGHYQWVIKDQYEKVIFQPEYYPLGFRIESPQERPWWSW